MRAAAEDGRTTEDGTCCGACQQVETAKKKKLQEKKPRTTKSLDQQGWLRTFLLSNYSHKHAELI